MPSPQLPEGGATGIAEQLMGGGGKPPNPSANRQPGTIPGAPRPGGQQPGAGVPPPPGVEGEQLAEGQEPGQEVATPGEQQMYEQVVLAAEDALYDAAHDQALTLLREGGGSPAEAIANVAVMLIEGLDDQSGGKIPQTVLYHAGAEVTERVATLASDTGVMTVTPAVTAEAGGMVTTRLASDYDGASPEEMQGFLDELGPEQVQKYKAQQEQMLSG